MSSWKFTSVDGYFGDGAAIVAASADSRLTTQPQFALLPRAYPSDSPTADQRPWARFTAHVAALNRDSAKNVSYKILFVTRHGQGFHNAKRYEVGADAWNVRVTHPSLPPLQRTRQLTESVEQDHVSYLDGDGETTLFDAFLTDLGIAQTTALSQHWQAAIAADGLPLPRTLYTSPLARCLQTSLHLLKPIADAHGLPYHPVVKDNLRERITGHTCDKRRTRSWIAENWPAYTIEEGFSEEDVLGGGDKDQVETEEEHKARMLRALGDVFDRDGNEVVSWTIHSLAMQALLKALGVPCFRVHPATTVALLVKGERVEQA